MISRREILASLLAAPALAADSDGWISRFDGKSFDGWKASEQPGTFRVEDGAIIANGPRSHLFYTGPVRNADFKNFELAVEFMTRPEANSGVYIHTRYQERGFPLGGFEIQINNTAKGEGSYRERKKTGSL